MFKIPGFSVIIVQNSKFFKIYEIPGFLATLQVIHLNDNSQLWHFSKNHKTAVVIVKILYTRIDIHFVKLFQIKNFNLRTRKF